MNQKQPRSSSEDSQRSASTVEMLDPLRGGFILLLVALVGTGFLSLVSDFLVPLILAGVFASLLYPVFNRLRTLCKGHSAPAAVLTLLLALLAIGLPLVALMGVVVQEAVQISEQVRPWIKDLMASDLPLADRLSQWIPFSEMLKPYQASVLDKIAEAASSTGRWLVASASTVTQGTLGFLLGFFLMLYAMFFFLIDGKALIERVKAHLPLAAEDRDLVVNRGLSVTRASLKGVLLIGTLQGLLVGLGMWVCNLNGAAFWGAVVFVLSAIPGVGAPLVWIPAVGYLVITGQSGWGIGLALWGILVVGLVDNVLRPLVVGRDAKLPDLTVLVSILGGIMVFGAVGIILGPMVAALFDTILNIYRRAFAAHLPATKNR